jgi:predicted pyridoxine 5'-phosphate oxidase superfamily flavin-nucleotide-binding protein
MTHDPFHEGEIQVQQSVGEQEIARLNGRAIAARIPSAARRFLSQQRLCLLATAGADGAPWATFFTGRTGFVSASEDLSTLELELSLAHPVATHALAVGMPVVGDPVGLLFIDLATRRRLRVNGSIAQVGSTRFQIAVQEAFPNCPKYIQRREIHETSAALPLAAVESGTDLTQATVDWIGRSDTAFVASAHPDRRLDASHRGGKPGFVRQRGETLWIPDYPGNSLFNTLGNFALNPRAGLTFVDFDNARQLQLTGEATLHLSVPEAIDQTGGTGRWWEFRPRRWIASPWNAPLEWKYVDASPFNP